MEQTAETGSSRCGGRDDNRAPLPRSGTRLRHVSNSALSGSTADWPRCDLLGRLRRCKTASTAMKYGRGMEQKVKPGLPGFLMRMLYRNQLVSCTHITSNTIGSPLSSEKIQKAPIRASGVMTHHCPAVNPWSRCRAA